MVALTGQPSVPPLRLPPAYSLVTLRESKDAFKHACRIAAEAGAGTLVWVRRFDLVEFAVVLEPAEALAPARRGFFAGMVALADALASHSPPERAVTFGWPDTLRFNGARLGGARLGWPKACAEEEVPHWLVFSAMLLSAKVDTGDPGLTPAVTWLEEEGFEPSHGPAIIESFARHLMLAFASWADLGFEAVSERYLTRLSLVPGDTSRAIDTNGDLLISRAEQLERVPLLPALIRSDWLDPGTSMPRLA